MKKFRIVFSVLLFCTGSLFSAPAGIGQDTPDRAAVQKEIPSGSDAMRALEFYIAALMEKVPEKKIPLLLESVKLDPTKRLPLQVLVRILQKVPASIPMVKKQIDPLLAKQPQNIFLLMQSCTIDKAAGCSPAEINKKVRPVLKRKPAKNSTKDFNTLALAYVNEISKLPLPIEKLPFETDSTELKEAALYYYSLAAKREKLSFSGTFARSMRKKYLKELSKCDFSSNNDLRRHITILNAAREFEAAYSVTRKELSRRRDPLVIYFYMDAAAQTGRIKILEEQLKKYPALSAEICAAKKFQCYQAAGDFVRAREELSNFADTPDRLAKMFAAAQMLRDIPEMKKILKTMESSPKKDNTLLALNYLSLAETAGDHSALAKAKQLLGSSYLQIPGLANAVGYVSAVLNRDLAGAELLLEFALSKEPYNAAYLDSMAWIKHKRGDHQQALEYIRKAFLCIDQTTGGAVIAGHAGDIYLALKDQKTAQKYYRLALEFYQQDKLQNADFDPVAGRKKISVK